MKQVTLLMLILLSDSSHVLATQDNVKDIDHMPRKSIHVSREELIQTYPKIDIKCAIETDLLESLVHDSQHIRTKPNRYILTTWKMDLNELLCQLIKPDADFS